MIQHTCSEKCDFWYYVDGHGQHYTCSEFAPDWVKEELGRPPFQLDRMRDEAES